jgi:alpha-1,2-mannosyltransferase
VIGLLFGGSRGRLTFVLIGTLGWIGLLVIGVAMASAAPVGVGFDLGLLVEAGRKAASSQPLYSSALVRGATVEAQSLFYSYPPFVAQLISPIAVLPLHLILVAWDLAATAAMAVVASILARQYAASIPAVMIALPVVAVGPLIAPFAIGVLFGNFNVFFPALYGLVLLAALRPRDQRARVAGGVALGLAAATKIHPAALGLWFLVRGLRERRAGDPPDALRILGMGLLTGAILVGGSVLVGGLQPWADYIAVARASSGAQLLDHRNYGPAAQIGLAVDLDEVGVRLVHVVVAIGAVAATAWTAWARPDALGSFAVAAVASLVILPVTWFHYPAALIPFVAVGLVQDHRGERVGQLVLVIACSAAAILLTPLFWLAVALALMLVLQAGRAGLPVTTPSSV